MTTRLMLMTLALAILTGCGSSPQQEPPADSRPDDIQRTVSAGYETVVDADAVQDLHDRLSATNADAVAVSAGRADWTTFRWDDHEDRWAAPVRDAAQSPFDDAVKLLGQKRSVIAVIDVFAGGYLEQHPDRAAQTADGESLDFQVSITDLTEGEHGQALIDMAAALAARDDVDAINLTELHYDVGGFGPDDEALYAADTGADGWPRKDGEIDVDHPSIAQWRSERLAGFVAQVAKVVHDEGDELLVDVRAPRSDGEGTTKFGQDYDLLLKHADRLVVWHYVALSNDDGSGATSAELFAELASFGPSRIVISLGLWGDDDEPMPADQLHDEIHEVDDSKLDATWVTPASLLEEPHWSVLADHWKS